jgi:hypothetical protein
MAVGLLKDVIIPSIEILRNWGFYTYQKELSHGGMP